MFSMAPVEHLNQPLTSGVMFDFWETSEVIPIQVCEPDRLARSHRDTWLACSNLLSQGQCLELHIPKLKPPSKAEVVLSDPLYPWEDRAPGGPGHTHQADIRAVRSLGSGGWGKGSWAHLGWMSLHTEKKH